MKKNVDWQSYVNVEGDFELPMYVYRMVNDLMKTSLDLGTMLSDDPAKLRAYKERVKDTFKQRWYDLAKALEFFDIIVACNCNRNAYCTQCGGSRYILNSSLTPEKLQEIAFVISPSADKEVRDKLDKGLQRALAETDAMSKV